MVEHVDLTWNDLMGQISDISRQIMLSNWKPDYIVGITRGGLVAATLLSHYLGVRMHTLNVALRDTNDPGPETNCWMAEDAFGYNPPEERTTDSDVYDAWKRKKILVVDDINDSGATLAWIKKDWQSSVCPKHPQWANVWNQSVKFAVVTNNLASKEKVDFAGFEFNKKDQDFWFVYPWENWWK